MGSRLRGAETAGQRRRRPAEGAAPSRWLELSRRRTLRRVRIAAVTVALIAALVLGGSNAGASGGCVTPKDPPKVAFVGVALDRPGGSGPDGTLWTPATFAVLRYVKGTGPRLVRVMTATTYRGTTADGLSRFEGSNAVTFAPRVGERWLIPVWRRSPSGVIFTGCVGPRLLAP